MTGIFSSLNISYRKWFFGLIIGQIQLQSCGILNRCVKNNSPRCQRLPISHWFIFCLHLTLSLASYSVTSTVLYKFRSVNCGSVLYSITSQQGNGGLCILPKILKPWNFTRSIKSHINKCSYTCHHSSFVIGAVFTESVLQMRNIFNNKIYNNGLFSSFV